MESAEIFRQKIKIIESALEGFNNLMAIDLLPFETVIRDGLMNGQIQKFEYSWELFWKLLRKYLFQYEGVDVSTPKATIKEFFLTGLIDDEKYDMLLQMLDDRNHLSHIYKKETFDKIYQNLSDYASLMTDLVEKIKKKTEFK